MYAAGRYKVYKEESQLIRGIITIIIPHMQMLRSDMLCSDIDWLYTDALYLEDFISTNPNVLETMPEIKRLNTNIPALQLPTNPTNNDMRRMNKKKRVRIYNPKGKGSRRK